MEKKWEKPELVVLMRSNPEETVLTACKITGKILKSGPSKGSYQCQSQNACYDSGKS
jgi:hypothetical protein